MRRFQYGPCRIKESRGLLLDEKGKNQASFILFNIILIFLLHLSDVLIRGQPESPGSIANATEEPGEIKVAPSACYDLR
jgi:hypothetical protein